MPPDGPLVSLRDVVADAVSAEVGLVTAGYRYRVADAVLAALQARRDAVFGPGNDKVWGEGNWVRCEQCPDATGWPSYHHRDFHR